MIRLLLLTFLSYALSSCASVPDYRPIVDTSNTQQGGVTIVFDEEKYANDNKLGIWKSEFIEPYAYRRQNKN